METVPFLELESRSLECGPELVSAVTAVLRAGPFVGGEVVERFEQAWAEYCGVQFCIGVANGLDAIRLALLAHGVGPGDEVLVPAQTFIATWLAVHQAGATPVPVDIDPATACIDVNAAEAAITPRTAGVVLVHLHGRMADVVGLRRLADRHGLLLIEDAAQAHGAQVQNRRAGAWGHSAAFSFYPTKNLGAIGDAGAITTDDAAIAERVRRLRSYGADPRQKYRHTQIGWNSRLDPIQAAALLCFLPHLDDWNGRRREVAAAYDVALPVPEGQPLIRPRLDDPAMVWHHFVIQTGERELARRRLALEGVLTEVHYPVAAVETAHELGITAATPSEYPAALAHAESVLSLPMHPWLSSAQVSQVRHSIQEPNS